MKFHSDNEYCFQKFGSIVTSWIKFFKSSDLLRHFIAEITPWSRGCIVAVTFGGRNWLVISPSSNASKLSFGCEGAVSKSNSAFWGKPLACVSWLQEQNAHGTVGEKCPLSSMPPFDYNKQQVIFFILYP